MAETATSGLKFTKLQPAQEFYSPVGTTLLEALESNKVPVAAACRAGVCGCCKTKIVSGDYTVSSTMTLSEAEIAEGYVLACSCIRRAILYSHNLFAGSHLSGIFSCPASFKEKRHRHLQLNL
ncbi:oxidoreductase [Salmonella enterica subsp. arizonae]|nr:oxidoreductase [Salmonella enterica subsp. arizonae]